MEADRPRRDRETQDRSHRDPPRGFEAIAEAAKTEDVNLRLERHNTTADLVGTVAWLAGDLVDVLHKVAAGTDPHLVMRSDLARSIHEAEVRLELLREMSR